MKRFWGILLTLTLVSFPTWSQKSVLKMTVLSTGSAYPIEGSTIQGGSWFKKFKMTHPAFLFQHPKGTVLFDTGLGRTAEKQTQDMVWWARIATEFSQDEATNGPVADQLKKMNIKLDKIIVSHVHFDHVSGLADLPDVPVEIQPQELAFTKTKDASPAVFPSLFSEKTLWNTYELENKEYEGYPKSRDVFADGSLVLVGLPGHTPGSVGLFVNISATQRAFLVGDTVWNSEAIEKGVPKFWLARMFADNKPDEVLKRIEELQALHKRKPEILIVPSHDAASVDALKKMIGQDL
ncbi:MBL fold metallo-hydrolase [Bdellovibrio sp. HCB-110]|uniref:MBL fold metallo-hydrolase n=1 Tax=Bdellovibrio sp. HCB-110 TaxID=3391182 RepID=UPI0039B3DEF5